MDVFFTLGALVVVIAIKVLLFFLYAKKGQKDHKRKEVPYELVQQGSQLQASDRKHVLVTGGCGYLGRAIVRQLVQGTNKDRFRVTVVDIACNLKSCERPEATYVKADLTSATHMHIVLKGVDCCIHTAAIVEMVTTPASVYELVNETGTLNVVEACLEHGVSALVFTSSASVVTDLKPQDKPIPESTRALPAERLNGAYARTKAAAERLVLAANCHVLKTVALRLGGIYGWGDPAMLTTVLRRMPYAGAGNVYVPFVWVEDAARAHIMAAERLLFPSPDAPKITGRALHICHDPVKEPFMYRDFGGGRPLHPTPTTTTSGDAADPDLGQDVNAYGLPFNSGLPEWLAKSLAGLNTWVGQTLGMVLLDPNFTSTNMRYVMASWACDISDARALLGWEPTPWRTLAARFGREWRLLQGGAGDMGGKVKDE